MRTSIRMATAVLVTATALGCGAARSGPTEKSFAKYAGVYRFEERVSAELYLDGRFMVDADTIEVELKTASCRPEPLASQVQKMAVSCGQDVHFEFDRLRPIDRAMYRAQVLVTETRNVCVRYVTNTNGQQVCAETRRETVQRVTTRSGRLRPLKLDNVEWGAQ